MIPLVLLTLGLALVSPGVEGKASVWRNTKEMKCFVPVVHSKQISVQSRLKLQYVPMGSLDYFYETTKHIRGSPIASDRDFANICRRNVLIPDAKAGGGEANSGSLTVELFGQVYTKMARFNKHGNNAVRWNFNDEIKGRSFSYVIWSNNNYVLSLLCGKSGYMSWVLASSKKTVGRRVKAIVL